MTLPMNHKALPMDNEALPMGNGALFMGAETPSMNNGMSNAGNATRAGGQEKRFAPWEEHWGVREAGRLDAMIRKAREALTILHSKAVSVSSAVE